MSASICGRPMAVFVDRDGTINRKAEDGDYIKSADEFEFLPGACEALRRITDLGIRIVVVTNQRGIALGQMTEGELHEIHEIMLAELRAWGAHVAAVYYCPHDVGQCSCRKPGVGMFVRAQRELPDLALNTSLVIGDSEADMTAAARLGIPKVLIGPETLPTPTGAVDYRAASLYDAVTWLNGLEPAPRQRVSERYTCRTLPRDGARPDVVAERIHVDG